MYGVTSRTARAEAGGTTLEVRSERTTRGSLVTALRVTVRRAGGFAAPVRVAVTSSYFDLVVTSDVSPAPDQARSSGGDTVFTVVFALVFGLTRGLKRRSLADMAPFEMVLLVVLGDIIPAGVESLDGIRLAVLEVSGRISVIPRQDAGS